MALSGPVDIKCSSALPGRRDWQQRLLTSNYGIPLTYKRRVVATEERGLKEGKVGRLAIELLVEKILPPLPGR